MYDTKRAVRDGRYKYIRNLRPDQGYYLAVSYREQMATMQELLRLRDEGWLDGCTGPVVQALQGSRGAFRHLERPPRAAQPGKRNGLPGTSCTS